MPDMADTDTLHVDEQDDDRIVSGTTVNQMFDDQLTEPDPKPSFHSWYTDRFREATDEEMEDLFDESLDTNLPEVELGVANYSWPPSRVLRKLDPIAYRDMFLGWLDNEVRDR